MAAITSIQNQHVKLFRTLNNPRGRKESGLFAVEGLHSLDDMLAAGWKAMVGYWCPEILPEDELVQALREHSKEFVVVSQRVFEAMSGVQSPQGLAAAVRIPKPTLKSIKPAEGVILALHEVRDPGNMGNMIRTADAAEALGVVAVGECADYYNPKVVRAAAGSIFHLPLVTSNLDDLLVWAEETGTALVATVVDGGRPLAEFPFPRRTAVFIGSEAHGLPEVLLTACDLKITIPMPGPAESLNAAIAAGIVLYEQIRQRL